MPEWNPALQTQFENLEQQKEASEWGMWTFLATEVMFFGGLFTAYVIFRHAYPQSFAAGSHHTNVLLGTLNTAVLLTSSFTMALAVHAAQRAQRKSLLRFLLSTIFLGLVFLAIKGLEYAEHISDHLVPGPHFHLQSPPHTQMFFYLYFAMTGLHAIHVIAGVTLLAIIALIARRNRFSAQYHTPVELAGLYWHFVDIIWVFLYPLLYLIDLHK